MRKDIENETELHTETTTDVDTAPRGKTEQHGGLILALGCGGLLLLTIILNVSC